MYINLIKNIIIKISTLKKKTVEERNKERRKKKRNYFGVYNIYF